MTCRAPLGRHCSVSSSLRILHLQYGLLSPKPQLPAGTIWVPLGASKPLLCAQRHAAHAAAAAAQAAGATQRALARSRAAADPTDIDATLAAASLSSSDAPLARRTASLMAASIKGAELGTAGSLWEDDPRPSPQRLFGELELEEWAARAGGYAGRTVDVEYRLTVEVGLPT